MNMIDNNEAKTNTSKTKGKFLNILTKILLYAVGGIGAVFLLALLYQILKFLFVALVLLIGCAEPARWKWW